MEFFVIYIDIYKNWNNDDVSSVFLKLGPREDP